MIFDEGAWFAIILVLRNASCQASRERRNGSLEPSERKKSSDHMPPDSLLSFVLSSDHVVDVESGVTPLGYLFRHRRAYKFLPKELAKDIRHEYPVKYFHQRRGHNGSGLLILASFGHRIVAMRMQI